MSKVSITPKKRATFERWQDNPNLRGIRIGPGNTDGQPESLFIKATVKKDSQQNSSHILVHNPATGKLIYKVCQVNNLASIGQAVQDLMKGKY
ncbi:hypothetical protein [uncultured Roseobacter sp.]|uniref:hypothetical protein n=1 Tax=uncultured Roseobacter sp. TaxID=114847 RepID=UPI00260EB935|nr:hypothetical protein [uncultured Roseobacter sp.]